MSSARKVEASRANGRKSRGPRSAAGKAVASRNALRHGLVAVTHRPPVSTEEIERFAKALCGDDNDPALYEQTRIIAQNELVLRAIIAQQLAVVERSCEPSAIASAKGDNSLIKARILKRNLAYEQLIVQRDWLLEKYKNELPAVPKEMEAEFSEIDLLIPPHLEEFLEARENTTIYRAGQQNEAKSDPVGKPIKERDEPAVLEEAALDLIRLDCYERRAWSQQKRAIRAFTNTKLMKRLSGVRPA
jgi:hypothetical protein